MRIIILFQGCKRAFVADLGPPNPILFQFFFLVALMAWCVGSGNGASITIATWVWKRGDELQLLWTLTRTPLLD
jgi:hypothetical protein